MAVVLEVVFPGLTRESYDQLKSKVGWVDSPPDGGISHVVWWEGDDCHGVGVWESLQAWERFGQDRMGPVPPSWVWRWRPCRSSTSHTRS
jgi:hypothetical protein